MQPLSWAEALGAARNLLVDLSTLLSALSTHAEPIKFLQSCTATVTELQSVARVLQSRDTLTGDLGNLCDLVTAAYLGREAEFTLYVSLCGLQ